MHVPGHLASETTYQLYYAHKALVITSQFNYKLLQGANTVYAGLRAGIAPTFSSREENSALYYNNGTVPQTLSAYYRAGLGFTGGMQAGYRRLLSRHVLIVASLSGSYFSARLQNSASAQAQAEQVRIFYFSGMIRLGVSF